MRKTAVERRVSAGSHRLLVTVMAAFSLSGSPAVGARRAVLVLQPELTAEAVFGSRSPLASLLPHAAIGVINTAVRGPQQPASAYLTLGAGERVGAGPLVGSTPTFSPRLTIPGWSAFRSAVDPDFPRGGPRAAGGLGEALRAKGGTAWMGVGPAARTRLAALTAADATGTVPRASVLDPATFDAPHPPALLQQWLGDTPLVVLDLPSSFDRRRLAALLAALARDPSRDVLLVSPYPPLGPKGTWDRLPPVLGFGPDFPPGRLTSGTTRTAGLVANIDVAPSLLAALGIAIPATMSGHLMRSDGPADAAGLVQFAREATLAQRALVPLGIGIGAAALLALALSLVALWRDRFPRRSARGLDSPADPKVGAAVSHLRMPARGALLLIAASPLALLLAPLTEPLTVTTLAAAVAVWCVAGAGGAWTIGRWAPRQISRISRIGPLPHLTPLLALYALTVAMVAADLLRGGAWVARSPLSSFAVAGIRFYGVGNEYVGVLVGMGMLAPLLFEEHLARWRWAQACFFLGLVLLIGSPRYGANLGGPPAAAAGFVTCLLLAIRPRRPLLAIAAAAGAILAAAAAVFLWDALQPPSVRSHIGEFVHTIRTSGWSAALPVLRRKEAMNFRLLTTAYALVPIAIAIPLLVLWYKREGARLRERLAHRPELSAAVGGSLVAAWSALLLKDSGISPWMFITCSMLAFLLDEQLREG